MLILFLSPGLPAYQAFAQEFISADVAASSEARLEFVPSVSPLEETTTISPAMGFYNPSPNFQSISWGNLPFLPTGAEASRSISAETWKSVSFHPEEFARSALASKQSLTQWSAISLLGAAIKEGANIQAGYVNKRAAPQGGASPIYDAAGVDRQGVVNGSVDFEEVPAVGVFEGVGPDGKGRIKVLSEGPIFHMLYKPGKAIARQEPVLAGRTPFYVLFGGGQALGRPWLTEWVARAVEKAREDIPGLQLLVIDSLRPQAEADFHFLEGDVLDASAENVASVAARALGWLRERNAVAVGAGPFIEPHVWFPPVFQAAVAAADNPAILHNPEQAISATMDKVATRLIVNGAFPQRAVPVRAVGSADDPNLARKAAVAFREIQQESGNPRAAAIMKIRGAGGKAGIRDNIRSARLAERATRSVQRELAEAWLDAVDRASHAVQQTTEAPQVMLEQLVKALAEYDIEIVVSLLKNGLVSIVGFVLGNDKPVPGPRSEKGWVFPAWLSSALAQRMIVETFEDLLAVWAASGEAAVPFGNYHNEKMAAGDASAPILPLIEINSRPIGGSAVKQVRAWSGWDVVEAGVRAHLGLDPIPLEVQPDTVWMENKMIPRWTGVLAEDSRLPEHTEAMPGVEYVELAGTRNEGDEVQSPRDGLKAGFGLGYIATTGKTLMEAAARNWAVMRRFRFKIRTQLSIFGVKLPWRMTRTQRGDHYYKSPSQEYIYLPRKPSFWRRVSAFFYGASRKISAAPDQPQLSARAADITSFYETAQFRLVPIFQIFSPIFTALMNFSAGFTGIGIGRLGYTLALFIFSPFASAAPGWFSVRSILIGSWIGRITIWTVGFPLAVWMFPLTGSTVLSLTIPVLGHLSLNALQLAVFWLNFMDGLMVSFSHPVDMDSGGLNEVSKQHDFHDEIKPDVFKYFTARYSRWSMKASYIFPTLIGLGAIVATHYYLPIQWAFIGLNAAVFSFFGTWAISSLVKIPAKAHLEPKSVWPGLISATHAIFTKLVMLGRAILDADERTWWDALRIVAYPLLGILVLAPAFGLSPAWGAFFGTLLIAAASLSSSWAAHLTNVLWKPADEGAAELPHYWYFSPLVLLAGLTGFSIPQAYQLATSGHPFAGATVALMGALLFGLFYEPSWIAARTLLQSKIKRYHVSTQIWGITSSGSMLLSGLGTYGLTWLFDHYDKGTAFMLTGLAFAAVGAFSAIASLFLPSRKAEPPSAASATEGPKT